MARLLFTLAKVPGLGSLHFLKWFLPLGEALIYQHCHWRDNDIWTVPCVPQLAPASALNDMLATWKEEQSDECDL